MPSAPANDDLDRLAQAFRALSNPNRLAMYLELLRKRERSVSRQTEGHSCALQDLMSLLDIGAPTVSHHTRELARAGLIDVQRDGKFLHCRLNESMRARLTRLLSPSKGS